MDIELETYVERVMDEQKIRNGIDFGFSRLIPAFIYGGGLWGIPRSAPMYDLESRKV